MKQLTNDLLFNLQNYYQGFIIFLPKLLLASIIFFILMFIANKSKNIVNDRLHKRMDDPLLARFLSRIVKLIIVLFALMIFLKIIGMADIAAGIITGASVSAIVIGFAFKDIGENFLAGIILAFNRPFKVGDTVELDGRIGKIIALNMRTTQLKSFDGKDVYIPNANIIKNPVVNYTIDGFMRQEFSIGLDYGSDIKEAIKILLQTMNQIEGVLKGNKAPNVSIANLNTSTLDLAVYYWLDTFDNKFSSGDIRTNAINQSLVNLEKAGFYMPGDILEIKNYNDQVLKMRKELDNVV